MSDKSKLADRGIVGVNKYPDRFAQAEHAENVSGTFKRIMAYFAKEKGMMIAMFSVVVIGTLCGVYAPSLQSNAIDIIAGSKTGTLSVTILFMLALYLIYCGSQLVQGLLCSKLSQSIVKRLRSELFEKVVDLPVGYLDTHSHGDVMSRMTNDVENISTTVSQVLPSLCSGILTIIGTVAMMLWHCWQLALLNCATVILTVIASKILSKQVRKYSRKQQTLLGGLNGKVEEVISGYRTVVAYNRQEITLDEFCETSDSLTRAGIRTNCLSGIMGPITNSINNIAFVLIAAFGGLFAVNGLISVGVISAFIVYARLFSRPINELAQIYGSIQTAIAGAERVFAMLDETSEETSGEALAEEESATVSFKNVWFSYDQENPVLRDFSLTVPSGKKVALVGATGSGKTTVVNLLMRFYDIESGEICINDQDISRVSRESLRKNVAIVLQDTVLFTDTIRNNLTYGKADAAQEQLDAAVKLSRCWRMIEALPQGYDTLLTGSGENISQGQRQLLAIARAFVADPRVLILDEATSNVDTRTEKAIQTAMQKIMEHRTSIVIAHRLSTIQDADLIVVLDHGMIVESGKHEELLDKRGKYYELYMTQYAGFAT